MYPSTDVVIDAITLPMAPPPVRSWADPGEVRNSSVPGPDAADDTTAAATHRPAQSHHSRAAAPPPHLVGLFAFHGLAEGAGVAGLRLPAAAVRPLVRARRAVDDAARRRPARPDLRDVRGRRRARGPHRAVPFARPVDAGRGTIWAPAIVHPAIDAFKLVVVPAAALTTFSLLLAAVSVVVPLLVLLPGVLRASGVGADRVEDAGLAAAQLEDPARGARDVEQGDEDGGGVVAGDRGAVDGRRGEQHPAGGGVVGERARPQDRPLQPGVAQGFLGGLL